ncbi:hypothetical protein [Photobacterium damselae]|uniref:hypothetical protein n=1 Tax=Photobacterium damselae TaxID=38293 RepID=UPI001EFE0460|nr:hypothetical protein [Photobacterium damselae]MCG9780640.1 hypothetical protein [Photobacterium damselae]
MKEFKWFRYHLLFLFGVAMSFSKYLLKKLKERAYTRYELLCDLYLFHPEFEQLNLVTVNRWATDVSVPSLYRQLLVCLFFNDSILSFVVDKNYSLPIRDTNNEKFNKTLTSMIEKKFGRDELDVNYHYYRKEQPLLSYDNYQFNDYLNTFGIYYRHYPLIYRILKKLSLAEFNSIVFRLSINRQTISHSSLIYVNDRNRKVLESFLGCSSPNQDFWLSNIDGVSSKQSYIIFLLLRCVFILSKKQSIYYALVRENEYISFYAPLGCNHVVVH